MSARLAKWTTCWECQTSLASERCGFAVHMTQSSKRPRRPACRPSSSFRACSRAPSGSSATRTATTTSGMILAPGSSLGGARPKASVIDDGHLSIAKFPKDADEYSLETWQEIAFRLAEGAGIETPSHRLARVAGREVLLSRRFDRARRVRMPFLSAMAITGSRDGERGSYPELADTLAQHGAYPMAQTAALFRRMAFNVLISNVDDHLRNHGFLLRDPAGWTLSPAYDLNPTPTDLKARMD